MNVMRWFERERDALHRLPRLKRESRGKGGGRLSGVTSVESQSLSPFLIAPPAHGHKYRLSSNSVD